MFEAYHILPSPISLYLLAVMKIPNQEPSFSGSSSSESTSNHYDVFLNFTRESTFTTTLCHALCNKGIGKIFVDQKKLRKRRMKQDKLRKRRMQQGRASPDPLRVRASPDALRVIEKSKVSILVFSEDYASSADCLDELIEIMKCRREKKQVVLPIFYKIEPTDVRHQKNKYGEAMVAHQQCFRYERVPKWKSALKEAADLAGWHFEQGSEYDFAEKIAEEVFSKIPPKGLHTMENIVGLDTCIKDVTSILDTTSILGIHGPAGVGKTTLAKAAYNSIIHQFGKSCFLSNIREAQKGCNGMESLQKKLLSDILDDETEKNNLTNVGEGIRELNNRLCHIRVLFVLDGVDEKEQLEQLVGDLEWCGNGSKIIVTTRNKQVLIDGRIDSQYEMKELNSNDSLKLFSRYAFNLDEPLEEYEVMSKRVMSYAQGLPLVLKVMGSELNRKRMVAWEGLLGELEKLQERKVEDVLKIMGK